ncbi:acyltransferase [Tardiphaga alba]|uniref:Acyltransferase n=1 Tax=Tardiphaga alba TaxID=340268 RepID=A0ABX8A5S2_9BRAD|nr:acyltransferase [Tardiphaga alba]
MQTGSVAMAENAGAGRKLEKFPAFDGFRGIGVVVVIFSHCPPVLESGVYNALLHVNMASRVGYVALDIFFVISGFFITRLLLRERAKTGRISFKDFYMRRALRIFPVYYLTILACYFIFNFNTADTISLLTYTFNFYHPLHPVPNPLEHTWSLSVEEQFYFFWPLLILLVPPRWLNAVTGRVIPLLAVASGLVMAVIFINHDPARPATSSICRCSPACCRCRSAAGWHCASSKTGHCAAGVAWHWWSAPWCCWCSIARAAISASSPRSRSTGPLRWSPIRWSASPLSRRWYSIAASSSAG